MNNNKKAKLLATWSNGKNKYRAIAKHSEYRGIKSDFIIEEMYTDGLGEPAWRECCCEINQICFLDLFYALESGKYELIKKD